MEPKRLDLQKCIHCGLCLQACPTFVERGEEADSPRGRIYLMRAAVEGQIEWKQAAPHIDQCLGCLSCQTACPSGVPYSNLIESARAQVEHHARSPLQRFIRRTLIRSFTTPSRLNLLLRMGRLLRIRRMPIRLARLVGASESIVKLPTLPKKKWQPQSVYPAVGETRARVGLLLGCAMKTLFPSVHQATVEVLRHLGAEVIVPKRQGCCGALWAHNGYPELAKRQAESLIKVFESVDYIAVNAAGCGSTMKEYTHLFEDSRALPDAESFSQRTRDVSELIAEWGIPSGLKPVPMRVVYQDACHLLHGQGVHSQPRQILKAIPGLELVEMEGADLCCGSAGIYNMLQPDMARRNLERKVKHILDANPEAVVSANPGCTLWLSQGLHEAGRPLPFYHPVELLAQSLFSNK